MRPPSRWPLHPAPAEGEALSSWLYRVARRYGMDLPDLLRHDLGYDPNDTLDINPPVDLLQAVSRRSDIHLDHLHGMTLNGLTPWLLDRIDPEPTAFDTYVHQFAVLLPRRKGPPRIVPEWRAWLPRQALRRACPYCLKQSKPPVLMLNWKLPLMLSCPQHGCRLESYLGMAGDVVGWEREEPQPCPSNAAITQMDHRTWQALTTGQVDLPRRRVHAGIWFRLLRTLVEELNTPLSHCRAQAQDIRRIWESCGLPVRAGLQIWRPYETLPLSVQLHLLEAAAHAMQWIETGTLKAQGAEAALLLPEPPLAIINDWLSPPPKELAFRRPLATAEGVLAEARQDPAAAGALFDLLMFGRHDEDAIRRTLNCMVELGVPVASLSQKL